MTTIKIAEATVLLILLVEMCCGSRYVPRSCSEVPKPCSGTKRTHLIDPDGPGNIKPFTVECDFSTTRPATIVHHNAEARKLVNGKEGKGSYIRRLTYKGADLAAVTMLVDSAARCKQYLKYQCFSSKLTGYGWFNNRHKVPVKRYFGGGDSSIGGCACYAKRKCADRTKKCNCDINDLLWRWDGGYVREKSDLPITGVQFGDTGDLLLEKGYHTIGALKCYHDPLPDRLHIPSEKVATDKILTSHVSSIHNVHTVRGGGARMCALHCLSYVTCKSFSVTESDGSAAAVCRLSTCDGEATLSPQAGASYHVVYR